MSGDRRAKPSAGAKCIAYQCSGLPIIGGTLCLAHVNEAQLQSFLNGLKPRASIDLTGTAISSALLKRILAAVEDEDGTPVLGRATFDGAQFTKASFPKTQFVGQASFAGATFDGVTGFGRTEFYEDAIFETAKFRYSVTFLNARFRKKAHFSRTEFKSAYYSSTRIEGRAWFDGTTFGNARFDGTRFGEDGRFDGSRFTGTVEFSDVRVMGDLSFDEAQFENAAPFGPLLVRGRLVLERTLFNRDVLLEAAASEISCVRVASTSQLYCACALLK
jgi:uncharacterized protein YjbI with pentapeptide repeats